MSNQQTPNGKKINTVDNDIVIDEETLARAILTFCLEGADAIMYTLLLGSSCAKTIVTLLHKITTSFLNKQLVNEAQQMQLPFASQELNEDKNETSESTSSSRCSKNQKLVTDMLRCVREHGALTTLDDYFKKGLKLWGYRNNNAPQSLDAFHTTLAKWCIRLTYLPTWEEADLLDWFTSSGKQWIIAPHSKYWPKQLQDLAFHSHFSPPLCLWGIGDPHALTQCRNPLAIVGSRSCTDYGKELAYQFAYDCASKGHTVISGGAYGIDAAAHWGAVDAQEEALENQAIGKTIAVFAGGLNHIGPQSNMQLFEHIIANSGACISELCPDTTPVGHRFLLRNRIIAALASKVIVAQARLQSGALNTATWASELNRELYAIPGNITHPHNAGCNKLIHDEQAIMVCSSQDIDTLFPQSHHYIANVTAPRHDATGTNVANGTNDANSTNKTSTRSTSGDDTNPATGTVLQTQDSIHNYTEIQKQIIEAISICRRKHEHANIDTIYEIIKSKQQSSNTATPSVAEISGAITLLELEGALKQNRENLVLIQQKVA